MNIVPCFWEVGPWCAGWLVEKFVFPLAIAFLVYRLAMSQLKKKRQIDFADKQLTEFYAPMLGARAAIHNHKVFDTYIYRASRFVEKKQVEAAVGSENEAYDHSPHSFVAKRARGERLDAYLAMRALFASKMAYADSDTREWYRYFYAFVEMLRVHGEKDGLTDETSLALSSSLEEKPLEPFYKHLQARTDELQKEIKGGRSKRSKVELPPEPEEPWLYLPMR